MKNIEYVMGMTKDLIDGKISMMSYALDFPYEVESRYKLMLRENREYAELIYEELVIHGAYTYHDSGMTEDKFLKNIRKRYKWIKGVERDGFW